VRWRQDGNVLPFQNAAPAPAADWRHIIRFGRNVASYKFALGRVLLELGRQQQTFVPLDDLAVPYAAAICEHLQVEDRQSTSAMSRFLDACRSRNRGELDDARLAEVTVRLGFANVIDAFHISRDGQPTQTPFFVDERATRRGITLTDHLLELANGVQSSVLPLEVDARWNLVQTSWGLGLGTRLVSFEITPDDAAVGLYAPTRLRRSPITGVRDALSGYQDGRCAYCNDLFTDIGTKRVAVDHVLPFVLMTRGWLDGDLHQIWNLVLACYECNSAKRDLPPDKEWMCWLEERNEHLITSHHPLRETLSTQLGQDATLRREALARRHTAATEMIRSTWKPPISPPSASITLSTLGRLRSACVPGNGRSSQRRNQRSRRRSGHVARPRF
jgi:5-methylcytosine-specific restriction endonuclease McrA